MSFAGTVTTALEDVKVSQWIKLLTMFYLAIALIFSVVDFKKEISISFFSIWDIPLNLTLSSSSQILISLSIQ